MREIRCSDQSPYIKQQQFYFTGSEHPYDFFFWLRSLENSVEILKMNLDTLMTINCSIFKRHIEQKALSSREWNMLFSVGETKTFASREYILEEGETSTHCYFLLSGSVRVEKKIENRNKLLLVLEESVLPFFSFLTFFFFFDLTSGRVFAID